MIIKRFTSFPEAKTSEISYYNSSITNNSYMDSGKEPVLEAQVRSDC